MIKNLEIKNFKSIKHLTLDCKRINLFIGEPNTGKSNILEAFGLLSHVYYGDLENFVRFESMSNLFYDHTVEEAIIIKFDQNALRIQFRDGNFEGFLNGARSFIYNYSARGSVTHAPDFKPFKFYKFEVRRDFQNREAEFLSPPFGDNLLTMILTRKDLRKLVKQIFDVYGLKVVLDPSESKIKLQKEIEDLLIHHPYSLISDTLQRIIFYLVAMETNENSVLVFEEPEAHAFPYYTQYLAERIALDKSDNQYFISTHNPYLLLSILEKAHKDEVAIFITYLEDYQTQVKPLSDNGKRDILDAEIDAFFNIDRFLEED